MTTLQKHNKTIIHSSQVPLPGNLTSQAVGYGGLFFLSGQIALDMYHHEVIEEGGVRGQVRRVLENIRLLLLASGLDLAHVLKVTLYIRNMSDLSRVDEVYAEFFDRHPPARTVVEVNRLPHDALVCIDLVAAAPPTSSSPAEVVEARAASGMPVLSASTMDEQGEAQGEGATPGKEADDDASNPSTTKNEAW